MRVAGEFVKTPVALTRWLGAVLAAAVLCSAGHAQDYPNRSVKIIVPSAAGGQPDIAIRVLAQQFSAQFGQAFVVENLPGANGVPAWTAFLKAPADGYTLSYGDAGYWAINKALDPRLPFDPQKDLAPIGIYGETTGLFLVVNESMPARSLQELVALLRSKPGAFSYASAGIGSIHHLIMEDFKSSLGLNVLHVPYKGSAQAVPALVGGQVSMAIASLAAVSSYAKDGRVRILGVSTKKRSSMAPSVPPLADAGIPDFDHTDAVGLAARAGTPRATIDRLSAALARAVAMPEVVARFASVGLEPSTDTSPESLAERNRQNYVKYVRIVKLSGATAD